MIRIMGEAWHVQNGWGTFAHLQGASLEPYQRPPSDSERNMAVRVRGGAHLRGVRLVRVFGTL